jgi:DNA-binding MarR family transcriptional regulator
MIASAAASAAITEAWAISTGDSDRPARRSRDGGEDCAGASGLVAVITRFCQSPHPATRFDRPACGHAVRKATGQPEDNIVFLCKYGRMSPTPTQERPGAASAHQAGLGSELLTVVARLNRLATQRIRLPLPWAQARLLGTIDDQGEARISDLAELDHCSQPTMTTQVRRLEDAGLVARTPDPADARAVRIRITPKGRTMLAQVRADRAAVIDPRIERLSDEDREILSSAVGALRRLLDDIDASSDR